MPFAWSHTFTAADNCMTTDVLTPFLSAINERIAATAYANQYPLTPSGAKSIAASMTPATSTLPHLISSLGSWTTASPPYYSWKALQDITFKLAADWFIDEASVVVSDNMNTVDFVSPYDYTTWPPPNGFTRKREPEISSLSVSTGFSNGDRARFLVYGASHTVEFLGTTQPATPTGEIQYSGKIMLRTAGVWAIDPDQTTRLTLWVLHGRAKAGDVFGSWILNELRDAINRLNATIPFDLVGWGAADSALEYVKRIGTVGGTTFPTVAAAETAVEANWTAAADVAGSFLTRFEDYGVGPAAGPPFSAAIQTAHIRMNFADFQKGTSLVLGTTGATPHTFNSAVDLYVKGILPVALTIGPTQVYAPRPGSITPVNTWVLFQTLAASNAGTRTSNWMGDVDVLPPRPAAAGNTEGWKLDGAVAVQRFRVSGGFTYV